MDIYKSNSINMNNQKALEILNRFNEDGWDEMQPYFGDFMTFYNYMKKNELSHSLNLNDIPDEFLNGLLLAKLDENPEETINYIIGNYLTDVENRGGDYWLKLSDREDLSKLFRGSRRDTSARDAAKAVLGEEGYEPYWDTSDDIYRDVIDDLNDENTKHLGEYIFKHLEGQTFSTEEYDEDFFMSIADENGDFAITPENVGGLIGDKESMNRMMRDDLDDLKNELHSIHNNAYNTAYTDELWENVMSELSRYFEGRFIDESRKVGERTVYVPYIKIRDLKLDIQKFLEENVDSGYNDSTMEYYGSYEDMLEGMMDQDIYDYLDFRVPDYPDFRKVTKYINEMLGEYI